MPMSHSSRIMWTLPVVSSGNLPRFSKNKSQSILMIGAHNPVRMNAAPTPSAASMPKERSAAISEVRLAAKAAIVVKEVSIIARPTREIDE